MWIQFFNLTKFLLIETAFNVLLDKIALEIDSHATCIVANNLADTKNFDSLHLTFSPTIRSDCYNDDNSTTFVKQIQKGVSNGCSFFVVSSDCVLYFLDNFREIHDWVVPKYEKKVLVVVDTKMSLTRNDIMNILQHRIVINDLPLTIVLHPSLADEDLWIDIWSAFPYSSSSHLNNRYFIINDTFLYEKTLVPKITDLDGVQVIGALMHYPPYSAYYFVPPGTGNVGMYESNETFSVKLGGLDHTLLIQFCLKFNCNLVARFGYDEEMWGESFPNHTGYGLIGALTVRDADVSCGALYSWDTTYEFTQYSAVIQRATVTHVLPKPKPLPYWQTPILPFPGYIWGCVTSAFIFGAIILFCVNKLQFLMNNQQDAQMNLFDSIFAVFMMCIFQGINININLLSNIVLFTVLLIYALIIGNLYAGGLSSVMTVTRYEEPIDSLEKLVKSDLMWGVSDLAWILAIQDTDYAPFNEYLDKCMILTIPELHNLVKQQKIAIMIETMQEGTLSYHPYIDNDDSKFLMMTKHTVYWQNTVLMASKTWPFMEQLNRIVLMQQESGIRYYWEKQAAVETMDYGIQRSIEENGKPPGKGEPEKLSVEHILGALFLLLFGNVAAIVVFIIELVWYRVKKFRNIIYVRQFVQK